MSHYRVKIDGKTQDSGYSSLNAAIEIAKTVAPAHPGCIIQVVDDGPEGEILKFTYRGEKQ